MKKIFLLGLLLFVFGIHAEEACLLKIGDSAKSLYDFGWKDLAEISGTYIWFSPKAGNIVPKDPQGQSPSTFNYNTLYRAKDEAGAMWYFRFSGEWFDEKTRRTAFYAVQWSDGKWPVLPGKYHIESVDSPRPQTGAKTFASIGDSMTWFGAGQLFRCYLAKQMTGYRFIGSNTDTFGYGHDGHGGDNTAEVLARLRRVPASDAYYLLIGSNDGRFTPEGTAWNIHRIVKGLLRKKPGSHVYISTLPVRGDQYARLAPERSAAIRKWYVGCDCHKQVTLVDVDAVMRSEQDALKRFIMPDLIHPSPDGYYFLSSLISSAVNVQTERERR